MLNNCFSFLAEGVRTEKDSSLKPHPLKPEKSAEGKDKNNSIVLDYWGFPGLTLIPSLIKIQHVMYQFNNKGPYSHLLFLICTSPKWVQGCPFCLPGCIFNVLRYTGLSVIHLGSLRLCCWKQQKRSAGRFSSVRCSTCETVCDMGILHETHIPPESGGCIPRGSIRKTSSSNK